MMAIGPALAFHEGHGSDATRARFATYAALLTRWNSAINLVSPASLPDAAERHFADSAQLFDLCPPEATSWADLGSGGGFPGLVIAILAAEFSPRLKVTLVEADQRKAEFLRNVSRETMAPVKILTERIETLKPLAADVISARALAPLSDLCGFAQPHLSPGGTAFFLKGANFQDEVDLARRNWQFALTVLPSRTNPSGAILKLKDLSRA